MDVKQIAAHYGGLPRQVVARAQENWRLTSAKKSAALDQFAGPVACILVAARALNETVDKKRLAKCAGVSLRSLEPNVRKVMDAVGVRSVVQTSPAALCIKFGCEALTEIVNRVFDEYRVYLGQVAATNRRKKAKHPLGPNAFYNVCGQQGSHQRTARGEKKDEKLKEQMVSSHAAQLTVGIET
ncbi:hypothetical protein BBJ29_002913 [Phytophthora kernoviae]|uniref:Uncharacterized protein n=1 Tax=Phytophthora kernoviae TaxID=325452 RepID=A0A3F2RSN8_9STRA|nr:hypothetical protein BBJ29_002913 [Phytophthora kernoviae]RLN63495.1 hypothetical protein BBP00_00004116 [Phytophthora kernoviae]